MELHDITGNLLEMSSRLTLLQDYIIMKFGTLDFEKFVSDRHVTRKTTSSYDESFKNMSKSSRQIEAETITLDIHPDNGISHNGFSTTYKKRQTDDNDIVDNHSNKYIEAEQDEENLNLLSISTRTADFIFEVIKTEDAVETLVNPFLEDEGNLSLNESETESDSYCEQSLDDSSDDWTETSSTRKKKITKHTHNSSDNCAVPSCSTELTNDRRTRCTSAIPIQYFESVKKGTVKLKQPSNSTNTKPYNLRHKKANPTRITGSVPSHNNNPTTSKRFRRHINYGDQQQTIIANRNVSCSQEDEKINSIKLRNDTFVSLDDANTNDFENEDVETFHFDPESSKSDLSSNQTSKKVGKGTHTQLDNHEEVSRGIVQNLKMNDAHPLLKQCQIIDNPYGEDLSRSGRPLFGPGYPRQIAGIRVYKWCPVCGKTFGSSSGKSRHMQTHGPRQKCNFCDATYSVKPDLLRHVKQVHPE